MMVTGIQQPLNSEKQPQNSNTTIYVNGHGGGKVLSEKAALSLINGEPQHHQPVKMPVEQFELESGGDVSSEDLEPERGQWSNKLDFILSSLGYAVGLGNVWRFPYLCYKNGGGAFLIPYTIALVFAGLPLFYMELCLGQYASLGPIEVFQKLAPLFSGLGVGMIIMSAIFCIWYNMIIAWSLFYLFASFTSELPWQTCTNDWNTDSCFPFALATACKQENGVWFNHTCYNMTEAAESDFMHDSTFNVSHTLKNRTSPTEEYFNNRLLGKSSGIGEMGEMRWELVLCLLLGWIIVFFCLIKGIKSSGKVVYFTALFPYIVLLILLVRGLTLPGAINGITFYIVPVWESLYKIEVWRDAAIQIFYSLGPAWGGLMTLASYNKFHNNCHRDAWIVSFGNCGTSVFAGFVIFSIIGFMAHELEVDVKDVAEGGPGLAFVTYPEVVTRLPLAPFWAIIFFIMLITLGLDSEFVTMETVITAIVDHMPRLRPHKMWVTLMICIAWFFIGLSMTTQSGVYVLELISNYAAGWSLMIIAFLEIFIVCYLYGVRTLAKNICTMFGYKPLHYWWITNWCFFTPLVLLSILFWTLYSHSALTIGDYVYPEWANGVGWILAVTPLIPIPIGMVYVIIQNRGMSMKLLKQSIDWAPASKLAKRTSQGEGAGSLGSKSSSCSGGAAHLDLTCMDPLSPDTNHI